MLCAVLPVNSSHTFATSGLNILGMQVLMLKTRQMDPFSPATIMIVFLVLDVSLELWSHGDMCGMLGEKEV